MPKPATRKIDGPSLKDVIELVKLYPEKTADDFVTSFNCDRARVHHARSVLGLSQKRPFAKRRNGVKPPGLKTVRTSTLDAKDKRIEELEKELADWLNEFEKEKEKLWKNTEHRFEHLVGKLHEELMQAKAVIAYLEKKVANGTSV
jgi:predicted RNase H-like nuclease (RuvC/YqgF family)